MVNLDNVVAMSDNTDQCCSSEFRDMVLNLVLKQVALLVIVGSPLGQVNAKLVFTILQSDDLVVPSEKLSVRSSDSMV